MLELEKVKLLQLQERKKLLRDNMAEKKKSKIKKKVSSGVAHIVSSFNNTIITISDEKGNALAWSSAGHKGFKGSRKSTPYAAQIAAEDVGNKAKEFGLRSLKVEVSGPGSGRESALRSLQSIGYIINLFLKERIILFRVPLRNSNLKYC